MRCEPAPLSITIISRLICLLYREYLKSTQPGIRLVDQSSARASLYRKKVLWKLKYFLACLFFCVPGAVSRGLGTATCKCARGIDVASGIWVDSRPQERIITAVDNNFKAQQRPNYAAQK